MARRSRVQGVNKLRRTFQRLEPEVTSDVRTAIKEGIQAIHADALKLVPKNEGDLARSIDYRISRDGLSAVTGPAIRAAEIVQRKKGSVFKASEVKLSKGNKELLFQFFKGWWIERGTKGSPKRNIPPMQPRPFMKPAFDMNKSWTLERVKRGINMALERAARGAAGD